MDAKRKRITPKERQRVYELCAGHCAYCGREITIREMQVDHYLSVEVGPAIAGGKGDINSIDNYLPACRSCNYRKSMMHIDQFRANVSRLHGVLMRDSVTYRDAVRFGQVLPNEHIQEFYFEKIGLKIPAMEWDAEFRALMQKFQRSEEKQREAAAWE